MAFGYEVDFQHDENPSSDPQFIWMITVNGTCMGCGGGLNIGITESGRKLIKCERCQTLFVDDETSLNQTISDVLSRAAEKVQKE